MNRPRTPTEILKLRGTYRADRHAGRANTANAAGMPEQPDWFDEQALSVWNVVVGSLPPGVLASLDVFMLAGACRWWSLWRRLDNQLGETEGDTYKLTVQTSLAWRNFVTAAGKLGLSPADREKLRDAIPPTETKGEAATGKERFFPDTRCQKR